MICIDCQRPLQRKSDRLPICDACREVAHAAVERLFAERDRVESARLEDHLRLEDREEFYPNAREYPRSPFYVPRCSCGWEAHACRPIGLREGLWLNHRSEATGIPAS